MTASDRPGAEHSGFRAWTRRRGQHPHSQRNRHRHSDHLTNAVGVTDVTFNLNYNPALLNISGTLNGPSGTFTSGVRHGWRGQFRDSTAARRSPAI